MEITFLLSGLIIGFSIAAPVGPIGVLCIRRTLARGCISGLVSGLGAATADAIYGCVAGFGLTFAAIFAGLGLAGTNENLKSAGALVLGVFAGSALWWLILCCCVGIFQEKFNLRGLQWVNRISGIIIAGFGLSALLSLAR